MQQYFELKSKHKDALLLFQVGDFYETFGEDAVKASKVLGIVLTARNNGGSNIELAGFPHHSLDVYLPKLVKAGFRVAVCEQLEKPSKEKKIVKRGVTDVITPGVGTHDNLLSQKENNFLASIHLGNGDRGSAAFMDLSTGEFALYEGALASVTKLISTYDPKEIIYSKRDKQSIIDLLGDEFYLYGLDEWIWQYDYCRDKITNLFKVTNLKGYGIEDHSLGQIAAGAIIHYLESNQHQHLEHINKISRISLSDYVWLDQFTIRNLELLHCNHPSGIPLYQILDHTVTPMGARLLKKWVMLPLTDLSVIHSRQDAVSYLLSDLQYTDLIDTHLKSISDLERIIAKVALRKVNPREIYHLGYSLEQIPKLQALNDQKSKKGLASLLNELDPLSGVIDKIKETIIEHPPVNLNKGGVIAEGCHIELDELRNLISNSKSVLNELLQKEIKDTGISNLKVGFNNVFGYYFEVTNRYKDQGLVPDHWTRKQTLTNAERYISEELKILESKILGAEEKINTLEQTIFNQHIDWLCDYITPIQRNADIIAQLDCLSSFAKLARRRHYTKPIVNDSHHIKISQGRHPVIEAHLPPGSSYIPNDLHLDNKAQQILLITGPNMSGKSAILRQTALICLMAQIGCYVPADSAEIGIVDRIFTRVGASDNISSGESTFMVEMIETSTIMNNLTARSLILLDEIGRGTSTYDGISIAWSIVEYLHEDQHAPKTLFATHYHELSQLADKYERIFNFNVATKEMGDKIIFMRKLVAGSSNQSFGIQVAQMSGLPKSVITRAHHILKMLQSKSVSDLEDRGEKLNSLERQEGNGQLLLFAPDPKMKKVLKKISSLDINSLTPIECMIILKSLVQIVEE